MSRNSSGNYTLPSGNPVVGGTTITTTWANATLGDLQSEMTDSLCRSGKGAMLAPLQIADGTAAAPSLTWAGDPDSGIYRAGAGDVRMQVDATLAQQWTATGTTIPVAAAFEAGVTTTGVDGASGNALQATAGTPNGDAVYATGTGTGAGVAAFGGTTSGTGVEATGGAPNGVGVVAVGVGTGPGMTGTGGTTGAGGQFTPGTAATATVRASAVVANSGDVVFSGVTNPNSNVAISNTLTAMNTPKAWATLTTAGSGSTSVTVTAGFNIASAAASTTALGVTFASAFANTNYAIVASCRTKTMVFACTPSTTTGAGLTGMEILNGVTPAGPFNFQNEPSVVVHIIVFGAQ